jgi:phosphatidylglycerol:prolipoprotein diacylglycerol transferase
MLPYLTVFSLHIPMYGLLIMLGSALGVSFAAYRQRDAAISRQDVFYTACYAGIGAFLGAKLLYLALTLPGLIASGIALTSNVLYEMFAYGFVFYGGVIGGLGAVFVYSKKYG